MDHAHYEQAQLNRRVSMGVVFGAITIGLVVLVPYVNGRIYPAARWVVGAALSAGLAGSVRHVLRDRPGENAQTVRGILSVAAGLIGLGLALLAGALLLFSVVGLS